MKLILLLILLSVPSFAKDIIVAEIDTGVAEQDNNGHGTHIAGIIMKHVCPEVKLLSCVYYSKANTDKENVASEINCFKSVLKLNPNIVNYSSGGSGNNKEEYEIIKKLSDKGIKIVVAAGNDGQDLSNVQSKYNYYPAQYNIKNLIPVGNLKEDGTRNPSSNYGLKNMVWEVGTNIISNYLNYTYVKMSGTSQAAAARTNRLLKEMCNEIH